MYKGHWSSQNLRIYTQNSQPGVERRLQDIFFLDADFVIFGREITLDEEFGPVQVGKEVLNEREGYLFFTVADLRAQ